MQTAKWHLVGAMEIVMNRIIGPSKEAIKNWLMHRQAHREPLPDRETIRRELGWRLVEKTREARQP
jgi:hypothetical protein